MSPSRPDVADARERGVAVEDAGVAVAVPAAAGVPEEPLADLHLVAPRDQVVLDLGVHARPDEARLGVLRGAGDRESHPRVHEEEAVARGARADAAHPDLEPGRLAGAADGVAEPERSGGRVAAGEGEAQLGLVGPAGGGLRLVLREGRRGGAEAVDGGEQRGDSRGPQHVFNAGVSGHVRTWPGNRRLRLRLPPNQPCQESAPFYGADSWARKSSPPAPITAQPTLPGVCTVLRRRLLGPEIVASGSDYRPTNPARSLHRSTAQTPGPGNLAGLHRSTAQTPGRKSSPPAPITAQPTLPGVCTVLRRRLLGPEIVASGSDYRPTNPARSLHRSTAQTPGPGNRRRATLRSRWKFRWRETPAAQGLPPNQPCQGVGASRREAAPFYGADSWRSIVL